MGGAAHAAKFLTVASAVEAELLPKIKGSRFIGFIGPVRTRTEALQLVADRRLAYPQANHHCFAYALAATQETFCSDDGEPHSTAGRPIQQVLLQHQLQDVCLIVSRIFGGTKLGTGGLVRAYANAADHVVSNATIQETLVSVRVVAKVPLRCIDLVKKSAVTHLGRVNDLSMDEMDRATLHLDIPVANMDAFTKYVHEISGGRADIAQLSWDE